MFYCRPTTCMNKDDDDDEDGKSEIKTIDNCSLIGLLLLNSKM